LSLDEVVRLIPPSSREATSKKLLDIILKSKRTNTISSSLAKTILYDWQKNLLNTEDGVKHLLEAALNMEPEKTLQHFEKMGLNEAKAKLESLILKE
jgi:hypothetical protein